MVFLLLLEGLGTSVVEPDDDEARTDPAGNWIGVPDTTVSVVLASERWWQPNALDNEARTDPSGKWIGVPDTTVSASVASDGLLCMVLASERR